MANLQAGQVLTAQQLNSRLQNCVARGRRTTNSSASTSTTPVGVLRLDDIPIEAGRTYRVTWKMAFDTASIAGLDTMRGYVRYTTDGSTPSTSSSVLVGSAGETPDFDSTASQLHLQVSTDYTPTVDETLSLLLCLQHNQGTASVTSYADGSSFTTDMYVDYMGDDPGNTGVSV